MAAIKNKGFVCSKCGQKIIGSGFKYKNNIYCSYNCAQQVAAEDEKQQKQLQNLYQYLKQRFQISDIPLSVIEIIDNKCNSDSGEEPITIGGMKKTIDYYFDILDNTTSEIKYFG